MVIRKIVQIDEDKCNGCGVCVPACHEGAIEIIDGVAKVIDDKFCDGLGDCLAECPQGAITIIERVAVEYDEEAVQERMKELEKKKGGHGHHHGGGCPGSRMMDLRDKNVESTTAKTAVNGGDLEIKIKSQLQQWPVQLMLVPERAPYFNYAELLITADCVPFAYPNYHLDLLKNRSVVVGCPKLDDNNYYTDKLTSIIKNNDLKEVTVAYMEVPCCSGMVMAAERALATSGKSIPLNKIKIGIDGSRK